MAIPNPASSDEGEDSCADTDNDGYLPAGCSTRLPPDCAPADPTIHPGALDVCGDALAVDEDCIGGALLCADAIAPNSETGSIDGELAISNEVTRVRFDANQGFTISYLNSPQTNSAENLLYTGDMPERLVGTHMWDEAFSYADSEPTITRLASGPAAHRFRVFWSADAASFSLAGTTTYTVFPDGRIHRSEELIPTGSTSFFTSYIALDPSQFTHRLDPETGLPLPLITFTELIAESGDIDTPFERFDPPAQGSTCAYDDVNAIGALLGYTWSIKDTQAGGSVRLPQSAAQEQEQNHQFALNYDWQRGTTTQSSYAGGFQMVLGRSAAGSGAAQCADLREKSQAFLQPATITETEKIDRGTLGDDNDDGYNEDGGFYQVTAASSTTLQFRFSSGLDQFIGQGAVVRVADVPTTLDPVVFLEDTTEALSHGRDYLLQHENNDSIWIYIQASIEPGSTIRIEFPDGV